MILTILKDELPAGLSYPVGAASLASEIAEAIPLERLGLYLMYGSGRQREVYDPLSSTKTSYPVLAVDRSLPDDDSPNGGVKYEHDVALVVFPVKTRVRKAVAQAIAASGMRSVRNWLASVDDGDKRPLVLVYHEADGRITSKFAEETRGKGRLYA